MTVEDIIKGLQTIRNTLPPHACRGCDLCRRAEVLEAAMKTLDVFCSNCGKGVLQGAQLTIECRDCKKIFDEYNASFNQKDSSP